MENPFIVVGKIKPEYFCDRQEESQRLIRQMTNGANTVIISPRRLGKTGLIGYCFNNTEVQENYITIFIDILRTSSLNELIYILGKKVFETIGTRSQRLMKLMVTTLKTLNGSFGYDPINNTPTFDIKLGDITNPTYTLEEIFACIEQADKRCIIAIDEFQQIVNYSEKNIEAILRTHIQHCSNANFIFAGSERHIMNEIFLDTARPFYNSAEMMMLKPIAETKYKEFVQYHFKANGKKVEEEAIDLAYQCFEGNTYYLQKTFRTAFSETERGQCVDKKQVADTLRSRLRRTQSSDYLRSLHPPSSSPVGKQCTSSRKKVTVIRITFIREQRVLHRRPVDETMAAAILIFPYFAFCTKKPTNKASGFIFP